VSRELLQSTCRTFEHDLNPHFVIEEQLILPALSAAGRRDLVDRTTEEHHQLRALIVAAATSEDATRHLHAFADLLTAHVRFEERTLFDAAQQILTLEALEVLATIRPHRRPRRNSSRVVSGQEQSEPGIQSR
jgi:hemerythrin-like domain-containing protein